MPGALQVLCLYIGLADALFLCMAQARPLAAALGVGVLAAAFTWLRRSRGPGGGAGDGAGDCAGGRARAGPRTALACGAAALCLCILGGAGHLTATTDDWVVRDAVLSDLTRGPWPVFYPRPDGLWLLRAPLGFYMIPALAGRALGAAAGQAAVLAQETALLWAVLLLLVRDLARPRAAAVMVAVFGVFSGLDVLGEAKVWLAARAAGHPFPFPLHLERWTGDMEYSSLLTDLFWAPNHGLPAFAFAAAYLSWRRGECGAAVLALLAGLCVFWSPLAVMGMIPFAALAFVADLRAGRLRFADVVVVAAAGAALAPIALYLTLGGGAVIHGFTFQIVKGFWPRYGLFAAVEIAPIVYLMLRGGGRTQFRAADLTLASIMLVLIPLYMIGPVNDFMMRASIVPLVVAAMVIGQRLNAALDGRGWTQAAAIVTVLAIGAATPGAEVLRAVTERPTAPVTLDVPHAWNFPLAPMDAYMAPASRLRVWSAWLKVRTPGRRGQGRAEPGPSVAVPITHGRGP